MDAFVAIFLSNVNKLLGYQRKEVSSFIESQMNSELEHCIDEILNKFDEITNGKTKSRNRTIEVTLENLCKIKKLGMLIDETKNLLVYLTQLPSDAIDKTICDEYKRKILLIKGQIGTYQSQFSRSFLSAIFLLNILLNNPRNQSDCNIAVFINPGDYEAYLIFLSGHTVVVAAVGYSIDTDMKADEDSAFVNIGYDSGIFALNLAFS